MNVLKVSLIFLMLAVISILCVDEHLVLFIHAHGFDRWLVLRSITENAPTLFISLVFIAIFIRFYKIDNNVNLINVIASILASLYFYLGLKLTLEVKTTLKMVFGRYWPQTWTQNNLSLIRDNMYGFDWLHGFNNLGSFPSGHSVLIVFCGYWLVSLFPSQRKIIWLCAVIPISCLVVLNYHYLGDCLAGTSLALASSHFFILSYKKICKY